MVQGGGGHENTQLLTTAVLGDGRGNLAFPELSVSIRGLRGTTWISPPELSSTIITIMHHELPKVGGMK